MVDTSKEVVQKLQHAEEQAAAIVDTARKNRIAMLKHAKDVAEDDLKAFRLEVEAKHQKDVAAKKSSDVAADLMVATQKELAEVKKDYDMNKGRTTDFVVGKVLEVPTELTATQKQSLTLGVV